MSARGSVFLNTPLPPLSKRTLKIQMENTYIDVYIAYFPLLLPYHFMTITEFTWSCTRLSGGGGGGGSGDGSGAFPVRNKVRMCVVRFIF